MVWVQLVVCLGIIVAAGSRLSRYADIIAEKSGLGRVWIGVVLLAALTSLPELITGIGSVTFVGQPDLTIGDLFGSNLVNLLIIAVIDILYTRGPVLHYLGTGIVLAAVLSMTLVTAAATFLYLSHNLTAAALFGKISIYSIVLLGLYLTAQYMIFRFQTSKAGGVNDSQLPSVNGQASLKKSILFFIAAGLVTVAAGVWLASIGGQITEMTSLEASFVGTLFLAICTSAPEVVVSISAARMGALDMAVGNMVGSNLFNMGVIIFVDDLFYTHGPIFTGVSPSHVLTALFALLMSSVVIIGIIFRPRFWMKLWIGVDSAALLLIYTGSILALYYLG